jgi:hypothetical protein
VGLAQDCGGFATMLVGAPTCLHEAEGGVHGVLGFICVQNLNGLRDRLDFCQAGLLALCEIRISFCARLLQVSQELLIFSESSLSLSKVFLGLSQVHIGLGKLVLLVLGHLLACLDLRCLC